VYISQFDAIMTMVSGHICLVQAISIAQAGMIGMVIAKGVVI